MPKNTENSWQVIETNRPDGDTARMPVTAEGRVIGWLYRCREWYGDQQCAVSVTFVPAPSA